jgi:hypothetical protein
MIREPTQNETAVHEALRRASVRGALPIKTLACDDVSEASLSKILAGEKPLTVAKLRAILPQAKGQDARATLDLLADLLGLDRLGIVLALAPSVDGLPDVSREVDEAHLAVADVKRWEVDAKRDGVISAEERASGRTIVRNAHREVFEAELAVGALPTAEGSFPESKQ